MTDLYWESTYAIVVALLERYPTLNPETTGLDALQDLIVALPNFSDDPDMVTERMLIDIQIVWYEEAKAL